VNLPDVEDRLVIIGRTGGGKTQCGLWHLSLQPISEMPFIIIDWKGDKNIAAIPYIKVIDISNGVPTEPGLYVIRPLSGQEDLLDDFLRDVWNAENTGLFVDEGMMLKGSRAFSDIQVQGRSKHIPVITLTQLPVYVPRTVFTEASYIQCFFVVDERYRKIISQFSSITSEDIDRLPRYYSWYYDVVDNSKKLMKPVPQMKVIMERFQNVLSELYDTKNDISGGETSNEQIEATYERKAI
jgi:hypothetical protein